MNWKILNQYPDDPIDAILKSRNIEDVCEFLKPDYDKLQDSYQIVGMKEAIALTMFAEKNKHKIGIFMDYDADGICGGAILYRALCKKNQIISYVPHRLEGYGLNKKAIDYFSAESVQLLITVDCGIRNVEEIAYAKSLGIKSIILDHHQLGNDLPKADSIVHPLLKNKNRALKFTDYSGGGVAYMFARAYLKKTGHEKWLLDLAAISSIADIVSLVEDNRTIVKFGLLVLNKTKNIGLQNLLKIAKLELGRIGTYEVGFMIAPRINAPGRMGDPYKSFELLTTEDKETSEKIALELNNLNEERQIELEKAQNEAFEKVAKQNLDELPVIILRQDNWNEGIIGLIAARVCEKYYRPTIVLTKIDGLLKGSARSISNVNITELLKSADKYLESYGGHFMAAGLSAKVVNFEKFKKTLELTAQKIDKKLFIKSLKIDALISAEKINLTLASQIQKFEPFGFANPRPIFALQKVSCRKITKMGNHQSHARLMIGHESIILNAVSFNFAKKNWDFHEGDLIDIAFSIKVNEWNGVKKVDLIIEDAKKS